jgi:ribosomal-protein-serine acetyltransferase
MGVLPERIDVTGLVLRRWTVADAAAQQQAVAENIEHLRPWMPWMAEEPQPLESRRELIARWDREWAEGGDSVLGVFLDGAVAGSCGLHRRAGPETLEIGYWIHRSFLRRGLATRVATMLTEAALSVPGIEAVEIHHDKANEISARVPRRLGYRLVEERPVAPRAPAEIGVKCVWRIERRDLTRGLADHDRGYRLERTR